MNSWDKLVISSNNQQYKVGLSGNRNYAITRTRHDPLLSSFNSSDSLSSRFVKLIADNDILRSLFFLDSNKSFQIDDNMPISETIPFVLNPDCHLFSTLETTHAEKVAKVNEANKTLQQLMEDDQSASIYEFMSLIFSDPRVRSAIKTRREPAKISEAIKKVAKSRSSEVRDNFKGAYEAISTFARQRHKYSSIQNALGLKDAACSNGRLIQASMNGSINRSLLCNELSILASSQTLALGSTSFCLSCFFEHDKDSFMSIRTNSGRIEFDERCPNCHGEGMIHTIINQYPRGLHQSVLPESTWLQEIIIGCALSSLDWVDRVYVHKKLHPYSNGSTGHGLETDVILVTSDQRMFLVEVTTQKDTGNVTREFYSKTSKLEKAGIDYDAFVYVTACPDFQRPSKVGSNCIMYGARHISQIRDELSILNKK